MPAKAGTAETSARTVDELLLDLICGDVDLLRTEFDAIIAAGWSKPPPYTTAQEGAGKQRGRGPARRLARPVRDRVRSPTISGWARQRSPPLQDAT
jgi:hypothetical protein